MCKHIHCPECDGETKKLKTIGYKELIKHIDLDRNPMLLVCSGRNSGKSFSIQNLIFEMLKKRKYHFIYIFSDTANLSSMDTSYSFAMKEFIYRSNEIDQTVSSIIENQKVREQKKLTPLSIIIIFDDIPIEQSETINGLATRGRHHNLTVIISSQKATSLLSSTIRNNYDYLIWRKINNEDLSKHVYSMLTNTNLTGKELVKLTHDNTEDYKFLMYDNTIDTKDNIFSVKAKKVSFKFNIAIPKDMNNKKSK